jgi:hypothetical protein
MDEQLMEFWEEMDRKIYDLIQLIRLRHPNFNSTPADKVVSNLYDAFKAAYDVQDAIAKGWLK